MTRQEATTARLHLLPTAGLVVCSVSVTGRTVTSPESLADVWRAALARASTRTSREILCVAGQQFPPVRRPASPKLPMALFGRKKTTVGLDIGSGLIKVAVIDHSKKEPELVRVAVAPLLADAIVEGEVMDPGIVAEAIQARARRRRRQDEAGRHRRRRPRRDHQEDPDRAREGAAGARADALGSRAARAVRHGVGGAGLPDPRSRRRRRWR